MLRGLYLAKIMFRYVSFTSQTLSFIALNQASFINNLICLDKQIKQIRALGLKNMFLRLYTSYYLREPTETRFEKQQNF